MLFGAFAAIAVAAEHLAVVSNGTSPLCPGCDVVGFHLLYFEMAPTDRANTQLALIDLTFGVVVECAYTEMVLIVIEDIPKDAGFLLHIGVHH